MANTTAIAMGWNRKPATPLQREHRHEGHADAEQRDEGRLRNLARAVHDGVINAFAMFKVPVDILDGNGGVVHQNADGERQAAKGHYVQRLAGAPKRHQRRKYRQRDRSGDDHGGAPATQEQQDHQTGQAGRNRPFTHHAIDRGFHEQGLVGEHIYLECIGQLLAEQRQTDS